MPPLARRRQGAPVARATAAVVRPPEDASHELKFPTVTAYSTKGKGNEWTAGSVDPEGHVVHGTTASSFTTPAIPAPKIAAIAHEAGVETNMDSLKCPARSSCACEEV